MSSLHRVAFVFLNVDSTAQDRRARELHLTCNFEQSSRSEELPALMYLKRYPLPRRPRLLVEGFALAAGLNRSTGVRARDSLHKRRLCGNDVLQGMHQTFQGSLKVVFIQQMLNLLAQVLHWAWRRLGQHRNP